MVTITTQSDEWWRLDQSITDPETQQILTRTWGAQQYKAMCRLLYDDETSRHIGFSRYAIVTAKGCPIDIASVTHPEQPRKFNLRELRRICSFPDDFQLTGSYEQRWERLGRSVPPLMMRAIASKVVETLCAD